MKKFFIVISLITTIPYVFAQGFFKELKDDGTHVFETTIDLLVSNKITEEIVIKNHSSFNLSGITCQVKINGKTHDFKRISQLLIGEDDNFDGYADDEMKDELRFHFGNDGRFTLTNKNIIQFQFSFGTADKNVVIQNVYQKEKDICFEIVDAAHLSSGNKNDVKEAEIIIIDGETYVLKNGQAYKVNQ